MRKKKKSELEQFESRFKLNDYLVSKSNEVNHNVFDPIDTVYKIVGYDEHLVLLKVCSYFKIFSISKGITISHPIYYIDNHFINLKEIKPKRKEIKKARKELIRKIYQERKELIEFAKNRQKVKKE